jgi:RNA polymerase sigma-70 factor (ECF subfamily)
METLNELIPTRKSLLSRLKNRDDQESWRVFFDTYWRLIYKSAIRAGLTDAEAQDVVQETVVSVMKALPDFKYDQEKGSFKGWLMNMTRWRIRDQRRLRQGGAKLPARDPGTATDDKEWDPAFEKLDAGLESAWETEWQQNLEEAVQERVRKKADARQYQVFDLHVLQGMAEGKVAELLGVKKAYVRLVKHRISQLMDKERARLAKKLI